MWIEIFNFLLAHSTTLAWVSLFFKSMDYSVKHIAPTIAPALSSSNQSYGFWTDTVTVVCMVITAVLRTWTARRDLYYKLSDTVMAGGTLGVSHIQYGDAAAGQGFLHRWICGWWDAAGWRRIKARHNYNQLLKLHTRLALELSSSQYADMDPALKRLQLSISDVDLLRARLRMLDTDLAIYASDGITN
ncbi:hypothetical protein F503_06907 [Ophiostoma piceae UAMH 11346]|uniref:Uncharacterized protein n=1 Tax=Ophiostoma piceae (strain UAMH 11346) TaxID=1262450 RepID=S3CB22_OPHP1|nr:hypothetical protein F503_06907 [Ophiostoma piceae UAMH 11346]